MVYLGKYVDLFCSEDPGEIPIWALGAGMETRASSSEGSTCFVRLTSRRALAVPPSLPARDTLRVPLLEQMSRNS